MNTSAAFLFGMALTASLLSLAMFMQAARSSRATWEWRLGLAAAIFAGMELTIALSELP